MTSHRKAIAKLSNGQPAWTRPHNRKRASQIEKPFMADEHAPRGFIARLLGI
jgi:hypothetical protein